MLVANRMEASSNATFLSDIWKKPSVIVKNKITLQQKVSNGENVITMCCQKFPHLWNSLSITLYFYCKLAVDVYWENLQKINKLSSPNFIYTSPLVYGRHLENYQVELFCKCKYLNILLEKLMWTASKYSYYQQLYRKQ